MEIALTFDDAPMASTSLFECEERAARYAEVLDRYHIQAVFFCIGEQMTTEKGKKSIEILSQKHFIANHSTSHLHSSSLSVTEFIEELNKTEEISQGYPLYRKWFRFPYLDYGDRPSLGGSDFKRTAFFLSLRKAGYQHAYTTIHTLDWYVNGQVRKAIDEGKEINWESVKRAYLKLLVEWIEGYNARWKGILKRKFTHVLLLHQNDLNALFLADIIEMMGGRNWSIVSPEKAFEKPIPYLSHFVNQKISLFCGVPSLQKEHVDEVLKEERCF